MSSSGEQAAIGVGILGDLQFVASRLGAPLKLHLRLNGVASEDNEFVAAVFRVGDAKPVAITSQPAPAGQLVTIDRTFDATAASGSGEQFKVQVGLAHPGGRLYLNGDAKGPNTSLPPCVFEIDEPK
jgi:hypothetical protein